MHCIPAAGVNAGMPFKWVEFASVGRLVSPRSSRPANSPDSENDLHMTSRLFLIQNGLYDQHTHCYSETAALVGAAERIGLPVIGYAHRKVPERMASLLGVKPAFSIAPGYRTSRDRYCAVLTDYLDMSDAFAADCKVLDDDGCTADDHVFVPYSLPVEIYGLAKWLAGRAPNRRPRVKAVYHLPDLEWKPQADRNKVSGDFSIWRHAFLQIAKVVPAERLFIGATVPQLAGILSKIAGQPVEHVPWAIWWLDDRFVNQRRLERADPGLGADLIICGDYRPEKGRDLVPSILTRLLTTLPTLRIRLQVSSQNFADEVLHQIGLAVGTSAANNLRIHVGQLSQGDFVRRLASSRLALLPYVQARYALRGSGVFAEALGYGVPVVAPAASWMHDCLAAGHGAGVVFQQYNSAEIARAVLDAFVNIELLERQAADKSGAWRSIYNASTVLRLIGVSKQSRAVVRDGAAC